MIRLLQIELNKLRTYRAFWILTGLYFVGMAGTLLSIQGLFNAFLDNSVPPMMQQGMRWDFYSLPDGWHYMSWIASIFNFLLPIIVIIIVSAEFTYKTARQNIISGMGRSEWMTGKLVLLGFLTLASTLVLLLVSLILGLTHSDLSDGIELFAQSGYILGYFIQTIGYLVFAMLLSLLIRNTGVVIGINMIYSLFLERILVFLVPKWAEGLFPLQAFNNLVKQPFNVLLEPDAPVLASHDLIVAIVYILLFSAIGYWIMNKRDI